MPLDLEKLAHDLRQPLQSISLLNATLSRVTHEPEVLKIVSLQRESVDQMRGLIEELSRLSGAAPHFDSQE